MTDQDSPGQPLDVAEVDTTTSGGTAVPRRQVPAGGGIAIADLLRGFATNRAPRPQPARGVPATPPPAAAAPSDPMLALIALIGRVLDTNDRLVEDRISDLVGENASLRDALAAADGS